MPTYVYRCPECGHESEEDHKITEDPVIHCMSPEHPDRTYRMERVIQPVGFRTPGDGFHDTGRV